MINESKFILTWCFYSNTSAVNGTDYIWETGHCRKLHIFICLFTHRIRKLYVLLRRNQLYLLTHLA